MTAACELQPIEQEPNGKFLDYVSREIRQAANSFLGMTELLLETDLTSEQREYVSVLRSATDRLLSTTGRVVRIAEGGATGDPHPNTRFDVRQSAEQTADLMAVLGAKQGISVVLHVACAEPWWVSGDKQKFEQILVSVITAFMKFSPLGCIKVSIGRASGNQAECEIASQSSLAGGEGGADLQADLALQVAAQAVCGSGGSFSLSSSDHHTAVTYTLPFVDEGRADRVEPAQQRRGARSAMRILLAEDSPENEFLIRAYLKNQQYVLDSVADGAAACEQVKKERYSLILMDIEMPRMDGAEAATAIREWEINNSLPLTPIIALTAHSEKAAENLMRDGLFTAYMAKPVRKQTVLAALDRYAIAASQ